MMRQRVLLLEIALFARSSPRRWALPSEATRTGTWATWSWQSWHRSFPCGVPHVPVPPEVLARVEFDVDARNRNEHVKTADERTNEAAMNPTVYRTIHQLICEWLRGVLCDAVQAGPGAAGGIGTVECRAVATLYLLLMDHPIDPRGRCRSCRRPGAVFGSRWRRCRVHSKATLCLHQLDDVLLLCLLADDLGLAAASPPAEPERAPAERCCSPEV